MAYKAITGCSLEHLSQGRIMTWGHHYTQQHQEQYPSKETTQLTNMASGQVGSRRHTCRLVSQTKTAENLSAGACIFRHAVHVQTDMYPCWIICTPMKVHSILQSIHDQSTCKLSHLILRISRCAVNQWHMRHRWFDSQHALTPPMQLHDDSHNDPKKDLWKQTMKRPVHAFIQLT